MTTLRIFIHMIRTFARLPLVPFVGIRNGIGRARYIRRINRDQ